jgi:hypothetical protein
LFFLGFAPNFVSLCSWLSVLRTALGNMTTQAEVVQTAYNSQQELEVLQAAALETCQGIEEGEAQAGSSLANRLRALGGHVSQWMRRPPPWRQEGPRCGGVALPGGLRGRVFRLHRPGRRRG